MGEAVDRPVIWGGSHRYQLGPALGERTFWAVDETGRTWAIEIGRTEAARRRAELMGRLPGGLLPRVRETGEMPGGRLAYIVSEWLHGYTLANFLHEGRRLSTHEIRRLGYDVADAVDGLMQHGAQVAALQPRQMIYSTAERRWRLLDAGEWQVYEGGPVDLSWLAKAMFGAGGSVPGEEPPWAAEDIKLWHQLEETLKEKCLIRPWARRLLPLRGFMRALGGGLSPR